MLEHSPEGQSQHPDHMVVKRRKAASQVEAQVEAEGKEERARSLGSRSRSGLRHGLGGISCQHSELRCLTVNVVIVVASGVRLQVGE